MTGARRILVVEEEAHVPEGHRPVMFAEIAEALVSLGCEVTVLTSQGWLLADPQRPPRFAVERLSGMSGLLYRAARWLDGKPPRPITRVLKRLIFDTVITVTAGHRARQLGADIIMTTRRPRPYSVLALANNRRWLVFQFHRRGRGLSAWTDQRWVSPLLAQREVRRRRRGGGIVLVANNEAAADTWRAAHLGADVHGFGFTGARHVEHHPDARARLGLDPSWRIALIFGTALHKRFDAVFEAFARFEANDSHPDWHLLVVGTVAAGAERWQQEQGVSLSRCHLIPGFVSEEQRSLVHDAADLVVLSFQPGWTDDSATLSDAVAWGKPVICADGSGPAQLVRELGIGVGFDGGNADSFVAALTSIPLVLPDSVRDLALERYGIERIARAYLEALDGLGGR